MQLSNDPAEKERKKKGSVVVLKPDIQGYFTA
jgi:hypothetical protein